MNEVNIMKWKTPINIISEQCFADQFLRYFNT